ncbi:hypothetical protein Nepgr_010987 [Nepenthes gracilis]|uniref:Uncharacterized protein n=1 Tax=Nepenthes gracilis TaxID=150966 RepID=A0AAD3XLJ5_NEPGR|nr:hypothetical protein Nepgr_010987 [Nepenthes gracilis]
MAAVRAPAPSQVAKAEKEGGGGDGETQTHTSTEHLFSSYLGISFSIFVSLLPKSTVSLLPTLQSRNRYLLRRLQQAEEQLSQLKSRRQDDSKANARAVEIFASHRNAWQEEERKLLQQIDDSSEEIARLNSKVTELERSETNLLSELEELKREIRERDELLNFMSSKAASLGGFDVVGGDNVSFASASSEYYNGGEDVTVTEERRFFGIGESERDGDIAFIYRHHNVFDPTFLSSASKSGSEIPTLWQDVQYESMEPMHQNQMKHFVARRESPWKVKGESTGVSFKLKLLEQELQFLERTGESDLSKVPSSMRKQVKRYQVLAGKIDDLCQRMQASDPCESALASELQKQRQTEFLLESFRLQQRASETGQKLTVLQAEINNSYVGDGMGVARMRRSLDSIRNTLREIQRNLEIWLARIIGDLEGILARDDASRVQDYLSRYSYV